MYQRFVVILTVFSKLIVRKIEEGTLAIFMFNSFPEVNSFVSICPTKYRQWKKSCIHIFLL